MKRLEAAGLPPVETLTHEFHFFFFFFPLEQYCRFIRFFSVLLIFVFFICLFHSFQEIFCLTFCFVFVLLSRSIFSSSFFLSCLFFLYLFILFFLPFYVCISFSPVSLFIFFSFFHLIFYGLFLLSPCPLSPPKPPPPPTSTIKASFHFWLLSHDRHFIRWVEQTA